MKYRIFNKIIFIKIVINGLVFSNDGFDNKVIKTEEVELEVKGFATGFEIPWGMAFLPDTSMLVTDLSGDLFRVYRDGRKNLIEGTPDVYFRGQGGLMDVEISPNYSENNYVYLSYSQPVRKKAFTAIARAKLIKDQLKDLEIIYSAEQRHYSKKTVHFGSRFAIRDDYLFFSIGDRGERDEAQDVHKPNGKIHRLHLDGSIPNDNPFKSKNGETNSIWCYGNRNPQGLTFSNDGTLWELEHGPRGGDELNIIERGLNYGWPKITYGINYIGTKISDHTHLEGMEQPVWHWTPSIAVCGMKIYENDLIPNWNGDILVTSLKYEFLERVKIENGAKIGSEKIYDAGSRVRDVEVGPEGFIYVALENPGRIVKIKPHIVEN